MVQIMDDTPKNDIWRTTMTIRAAGIAVLVGLGATIAAPTGADAQQYYHYGPTPPTYYYYQPAPQPRARRNVYRYPDNRGYVSPYGYQEPIVRRQRQRDWYGQNPYGQYPSGNPYMNRGSPNQNFGTRDN
jgi:hypothetical protein